MNKSRKELVAYALLSGFLLAGSADALSQMRSEASQASSAASSSAPATSKIRSAEDGWLDISSFIDQAYGFVPLVVPITEPAVGYGATGALVFIDKQQSEAGAGFGRPNISAVGGLGTENGTRGLFAMDSRHWLNDQLKTMLAGIKTTVNLDYYGGGAAGFQNKAPLSYALELSGVMAQAKYRLGQSQNWLGLGYALATTTASFDILPGLPRVPDVVSSTRIGGVMPAFTHDSRDNMFTPRSGQYFEISAGVFDKAFGGDRDFRRFNVDGVQYFPLATQWSLGLREGAALSNGDTPFYALPFVSMRGVPAMRYQGDRVAQLEAELRWQFWQRFSLVAFAGAGSAVSQVSDFSSSNTVSAGGAGFRYEIARQYGLHMGLDVATSRDGPAIYVQFGSAWMRP